ncbi:hypothetical protein, partial [Microbacterium sp. 71-23]|uniref:hypothetical protein n=1 Tax=Microbacterium sp. 71-23 TaxID=1895787 RepID=UPI0025808EEF
QWHERGRRHRCPGHRELRAIIPSVCHGHGRQLDNASAASATTASDLALSALSIRFNLGYRTSQDIVARTP